MSVSTPHLVGRDAELEVFDRTLDEVDGGQSRALGLLGEPGIGKSRLLGELAARAAARGHLVLAGRAAELERDVPFALWADALDGRVAELPAETLDALGAERLADLAVAVPAIARRCAAAPSPTVERHRVARALRGLIEELVSRRPVTVVLDDVHWADPASADVVALLLHRPPACGTLLALAARSGRDPRLEESLQGAAHHGGARALELGALSRDAAAALLPDALGPAARARLYRESGGNPFFLQSLASAGAAASGPAERVAGGVPRAVLAALAGEIARLHPPARALVQGAAVAGDPFDLASAAAAAGLSEREALEALDGLLACELVRPTDDPRRWRFRHPLVRRAVYESAGGGWRLAAHGRAAELLARRGATPVERAHHVARAAQAGEMAAVELLDLAARRTATAAPGTAAEWLQAALRLLPHGAEHGPRRLALLRARATALAAAGQPVQALGALRDALDLLAPDASERVAVVIALAELEAVWTGQPEQARRRLTAERERLAASTPDGTPSGGPATEPGAAARGGSAEARGAAAGLTLALAAERAASGDHAATERLADEACAAARAAGDRVLEAAAAAGAADAAHCRLRGDDPAALDAVDAKIAAATRLAGALSDEQVAERLHMLLSLTLAHLSTGSPQPALAAVQRGYAIARATGQGLLTPAFQCMRGFVAYELGQLDAAEADDEEALEAALISGNVPVAYWASVGSSWCALARGKPDEALVHGQSARDLVGAHGGSQAGFSVADARLAAGDPQGALDALKACGWVSPRLWTLDRVKAADVAVRALIALGRLDGAEARARLAPAECGGRRTGVCGAIVAHTEASLLLARGDARTAARVAAAGAAAAGQAQAPLWAGRCRTLAAGALAAAGQATKAREEARHAAAALGAWGAWGYHDAALRVLRRLGERPRPPAAAAPRRRPPATSGTPGHATAPARRDPGERLSSLTAREREVAALLAAGDMNAQIAHRLHLSESAVEKHVSRVLAKLGVSSQSGVAALLARAPGPGSGGVLGK